jgi:hypothetical protein
MEIAGTLNSAATEATIPKKAWTKKTPIGNTAKPMSPAPSVWKRIVLTGLVYALPMLVFGQSSFVPSGGEYAISGPRPLDQVFPAVAINSVGGWAAWTDPSIDGKGSGIAARKLDPSLNPVGDPIRINSNVLLDQERPSVALTADGAVMAWLSGAQGFQNVSARFLNADGSWTNRPEVIVSMPSIKLPSRVTTNWLFYKSTGPYMRTQRIKQNVKIHAERASRPAVATLSDGTVVIAYSSARRITGTIQGLANRVRNTSTRSITNSHLISVPVFEDNMEDVYFQRYTATGEKIGDEVRANQQTFSNQRSPAIAAQPNGTFVLTWTSELQRTNRVNNVDVEVNNIELVARVFANDGTSAANEFLVNTEARPCSSPAVAATPSGFTIIWAQKDSGTNSLEIYARAYDASGSPATGAFVVNTYSYGDQYVPQIASTPNGQLIVWTSLAQDGSREGVYGRWLNGGSITSDEFRVNTTTNSRQVQPAVSADTSNRALVIWSSFQTQAGMDLYGQRYTAQ